MYQFCYNKQTVINIKFLFLIIVSVGFWSCEKGDQQIGTNFIGGNTLQINKIDSFTVKTSTVLLDSIQTSNNSNPSSMQILVGRYIDPYLGNVSCKSFFQLDLNQSFQPDVTAVYDSLVLTLAYSYSYGDTTKAQNLYVQQLTSIIDPNKYYFNTSTLSTKPEILGSVKFKARPGLNLPLHIKMSDILGNNIMNRGFAGTLTGDGDWLNIFNGMALSSDNLDNASILGFNSNKDSTALRLFYHYQGSNGNVVNSNLVFKIGFGFNSISSDRKLTKLSSLKNPQDMVSTSLTNEQAFVQSGIGIGTRIDFPYIQQLQNSGFVGLNQVYLTIKPVRTTIDPLFPLPSTLTMYSVNEVNFLTNFTIPQDVGYRIDPGTGEITYTFNLYQYVDRIVRGQTTKWDGLILATSNNATPFQLNRLILGSQNYPKNFDAIKLNVYFTNVPK